MTVKPVRVAVCVRDATDEESAKRLCKTLPAYREILRTYPSAKYERKFDGVELHHQAQVWLVHFLMTEKETPSG